MPNKNQLDTAQAVIEALGGEQHLADLFGVHHKAVANWRYFGFFPANTADALRELLREKKLTAPAKLWAMRQIRPSGSRAKRQAG